MKYEWGYIEKHYLRSTIKENTKIRKTKKNSKEIFINVISIIQWKKYGWGRMFELKGFFWFIYAANKSIKGYFIEMWCVSHSRK